MGPQSRGRKDAGRGNRALPTIRRMTSLGYALSSEEHTARDLVDHAVLAERPASSSRSSPTTSIRGSTSQGHSPFVWSVLGAIAHRDRTARVGTGVTCPTMRIHPAIIAQAAATVAAMMPGRFLLGVGTGENLNEHILGARGRTGDVRLEMLEEAVEVIRELWTGEEISHRGEHYTVENARIYTLPDDAAADRRRGRRPDGGRARRADRRRVHRHRPGARSSSTPIAQARRQGPAASAR